MTIEYVLLMIIGGVVMMTALIKYPKQGMEEGSVRLAARVETSIATGTGFEPYNDNSEQGRIPWIEKE